MRALVFLLGLMLAGQAFADSGQDIFDQQCVSCHALMKASTANGPSLTGVVWRNIASLPDFSYTPALKSTIGTWSPDRLDQFLKDTQAFAPGTSMFFAIQDRSTRRALIKYLETLK
jgi:cytochrome c2